MSLICNRVVKYYEEKGQINEIGYVYTLLATFKKEIIKTNR